jgi:hypothetical protein
MALTPKITKTEYTLTPEEVCNIIAEKLGLPEDETNVRFVIREVGGDPMDRFPGTPTVVEISVTHEKKLK